MGTRAGDYWDEALSVRAYLDQMTQNREIFERRIEATELTDAERDAFRGAPLRFLVLTEDFCGDSAQFIPPVIKLASELPNVEVRLLLRDRYRELAAGYVRKDGYQAIPVLIVLDGAGEELGHLVERPARVNEELSAETRRFARENAHLDGVSRTYDRMPAETRAAIRANANHYRDAQQGRWSRWLLEDLAGIAGRNVRAPATAVA